MRTAVLISGRGSNLAALINACARPGARAAIALVISNRPDAGGLQHARDAGISVETVDHRRFEGRDEFDRVLGAGFEADLHGADERVRARADVLQVEHERVDVLTQNAR